SHRLGGALLLVVAVHSLLDGVPLAFPQGAAALSAALLLHKVPEGLAIAAVARASGFPLPQAIAVTAAVEGCTLVGAALGVALGHAHGAVLAAGMGLVAGSFLSLVA